jgi:adenine specific DNA methylase Mod
MKKTAPTERTGVIYCGDNLAQLPKLPDASIDLIYIDPPFNSNRNYEVFWGETKEKRAFEDRHESTRAYIEFMRPRCLELARVLKKTGSFYYHCDWHASHYVKVMLDQIFGENSFLNEIIWKRQSAHSDAKQGSKHLGRVHDTIFLYAQGDHVFTHQYKPYDSEYVEKFYKHVEPGTGRRYSLGDITAPGGAAESKGNPFYEFLGVERYWRFSKEEMERLYKKGDIVQVKPGSVPRQKRYLDKGKGVPVGTIWDDIGLVQSSAGGELGLSDAKTPGPVGAHSQSE